ncbi:MAG: JDVT-CTERM domain-containing protein, partial [Gammaproteobacteria bacterium]
TGTGADCTTAMCGAGIIDAAAAVNQVRRTVTVAATDPDAAEAGLDPGAFTLSRSGDISTPLTVNYIISGGTLNGSDYTALPTSMEIPAGATSVTFTVTPIDDNSSEGPETLILTVSPDIRYVSGTPGSATISIADNESAPSMGGASSSGGGGGGCTLGSAAGFDPGLPLLLMIATLYLLRRRKPGG